MINQEVQKILAACFLGIFLLGPAGFASNKLVVEFKHRPNANTLNGVAHIAGVQAIQPLSPYKSDYFSRVYEVTVESSSQGPRAIAQNIAQFLARRSDIKKVEEVGGATILSIAPSKNSQTVNFDMLGNYQWALSNDGQTVFNRADDVKPEVLAGAEGFDINWLEFQRKIEPTIRNRVVVAIIDSGVDIRHPDLKNHIFYNKIECSSDGEPDPGAHSDNDNNGYVGDCAGWNFVDYTKPNGGPVLYDQFGHGTHLAGIVAAEINNHLGISGVSNHIEILPLQVYTQDQKHTPVDPKTCLATKGEDPLVALTSNIAKAILYATEKKVSVINLSLGWPERAHSDFIKNAILEAQAKGVIIVAAAGNNNNDAPIYPCAMKDVICVGASRIDGSVAPYSNYGGHVDLLAPGDNILSTIPTLLTSSNSIKGYEIRSGTSQAAPYVAAAAAALRAQWPEIKSDEVLARLAVSARTLPIVDSTKTFSAGQLDLYRAFSTQPKPVVRPIFKNVAPILFENFSDQLVLRIPIHNFWANASKVKLNLVSSNDGLKLTQHEFSWPEILSGETKIVEAPVRLLNNEMDRNITIQVEIAVAGMAPAHFDYRFTLARKQSVLQTEDRVRIQADDAVGFDSLQSVPVQLLSHQVNSSLEYAAQEVTAAGIKLRVFRRAGSSLNQIGTVILTEATSIFFFEKVQSPAGAGDVYLLGFLKLGCNSNQALYQYFDEHLAPLTPAFAIDKDSPAFITFADLELANFVWSNTKYGALPTPIFTSTGYISPKDQNASFFKKNQNAGKHIYFFELGLSQNITVRTFDNDDVFNRIKKALHLGFRDIVYLLDLAPQSTSDLKINQARALFTVTKLGHQSTLELIITPETIVSRELELHTSDFGSPGLELFSLRSVIDLGGLDDGGAFVFSTLINSKLSQTFMLKSHDSGFGLFQKFRASPIDSRESFLGRGYLATYAGRTMNYSLYVTEDRLVVSSNEVRSQRATQVEANIMRSSFLPGASFSEILYPMVTDTNLPAVLVNATDLFKGNLYVWRFDGQKILAPAALNFQLESDCRPLNPVRTSAAGGHSLAIACGSEGHSDSIYFYQLK